MRPAPRSGQPGRRADAYDSVHTTARVIDGTDGLVRVRVRAQPRASRTEVVGEYGGALKVRLAAPPVDGAANEELVRFIAKRLGVAKSAVRVVSGDAARSKVVEIEGVDVDAVRLALLGRTSK